MVSESKPFNETLLETSVDSKIKYERQFKDESETMLTSVNSFLIPNPIPYIYQASSTLLSWLFCLCAFWNIERYFHNG